MTRNRSLRLSRRKGLQTPPAIKEPNKPGSAFYAERHRKTVSVMGSGMRIISAGEPTRAIGRDQWPLELEEAAAPPIPVSVPAAQPDPAPAATSPERDFRKEYGLRSGS